MLFALIYFLAVISVLYLVLKITWKLWTRRYNFIVSAPNVPWLGTLPFIDAASHKMYLLFLGYSNTYNHLYTIWMGPKATIRMGKASYIEAILKSQNEISKSWLYSFTHEWLGTGLLTSTGEKWKSRRVALTHAFNFTILNGFLDIFEAHAMSLVDKLHMLFVNEKAVEIQYLISLSTLDVMCETSMGVKINALETADSDYVTAIKTVKRLVMARAKNLLLWPTCIFKLTSAGKAFYYNVNMLHKFTTDVINRNIENRRNLSAKEQTHKETLTETGGRHKRFFLDTLLDLYDKGEIDVDGIREEVDTFMFEGHDTTSSALSWALYEIGRHPDIQQKIHDEIDRVSPMSCSLMDKTRELKYLETVIKEALRFHPPVAIYGRLLGKDLAVGNHAIPAGTETLVDAMSVHMNAKYWEQPDIFNPDRFSNEEFLKRNPYCYVPFSSGPRNCIGQKYAMLEMKIFLYTVLRNFEIKSLQEWDELDKCIDMITYSGNGINMQFSSR